MTGQRLVVIVTLSIVAAIVLLTVTFIIFKEDMVRFTTKSALRSYYTKVTTDTALVAVDTLALGNVLRAFSDRVDSLPLDNPKFFEFMSTMQRLYTDGKISVSDVDSSMASIIAIYPDLGAYWHPTNPVHLSAGADSISKPADSISADSAARHKDSAK